MQIQRIRDFESFFQRHYKYKNIKTDALSSCGNAAGDKASVFVVLVAKNLFSFRCSVDFFTGSFLCGFYFVVTVFDDRFSGYDPDEGALVIYHRYEVLINGAIQEIFHIGICMDWFIGGATWDRHDRDSFCFLDVVDICTAHAPEEISL